MTDDMWSSILRKQDELDLFIERTKTNEDRNGSGTSNPTTYPANRPFFRTDLGMWIYYDGTRWLSVQEYMAVVTYYNILTVAFAATTAGVRVGIVRGEYLISFVRARTQYLTGGTNNATNYITYTFVTGATTILSFDSSAQAASTLITTNNTTFAAQPAASQSRIVLDLAVTGAPSAQAVLAANFWYRLAVT